jgi:hypothetical protein
MGRGQKESQDDSIFMNRRGEGRREELHLISSSPEVQGMEKLRIIVAAV